MCHLEPLVFVEGEDHQRTVYAKVTPEVLETIFEEHLLGDNVVISHRVVEQHVNFLSKQKRIALKNIGNLNPESFEDYENREGFRALQKVLESSQKEVLKILQKSGIKEFETNENLLENEKCIVCNADVGFQSAFIDRSLLEGNPYLIIEGMMIVGYALGVSEGCIYVNSEFPYAIEFLQNAVDKLKNERYLGNNIFGSGFDFELHIKEGFGEFLDTDKSFFVDTFKKENETPKVKNFANIGTAEIFAKIPWAILNSSDEYKKNKTKVFAISGKIKRSGLIEVPVGTTLREIIFEIGNGMKEDGTFKAVQLGGLLGCCLSEQHLDMPIDHEATSQISTIMDCGSIVVMDERACMVDVAKRSLLFALKESCGKCSSCRIGIQKLLGILEGIVVGNAKMEDIDKIYKIAENIKKSSRCSVGQTAPDPVISTLDFFRDEYTEHIENKKCRAKVCKFGAIEVV